MNKEKMIELAQGQLDAYNARDLEKFCSFYHPNVLVYKLTQSEPISSDFETFTNMYKVRFAENPELHCELKSRVVLKDSVLDEEWVTGAGAASHVVAIYGFKDDLISHVWFTR